MTDILSADFKRDGAKLRSMLVFGFVSIILIMIVILGIMLRGSQDTARMGEYILKERQPLLIEMLRLEQQLDVSATHLATFLLTGEKASLDNYNYVIDDISMVFTGLQVADISAKDKLLSASNRFEILNETAKRLIRYKLDDQLNYPAVEYARVRILPVNVGFNEALDVLIDEYGAEDIDDLESIEVRDILFSVRFTWQRMINTFRVYLLSHDENDIGNVDLYLDACAILLGELEAKREFLGFNAEELDNLIRLRSVYVEKIKSVKELTAKATWRMDAYLMKDEFSPQLAKLKNKIGEIVSEHVAHAVSDSDNLQVELDDTTTGIVVAMIFSIMLGGIIVYIISIKIIALVAQLNTTNRLARENHVRAEKRANEMESLSKKLETSITELTETQEQMINSEKMASLGRLVAGIAHEINTPLGICITAASFHSDKIKDIKLKFDHKGISKSELREFFDKSLETCEILLSNLDRGANLVGSFKQVAVDQTSESKREFNLCQYVNEVLLSLRPRLKKTKHIVEVNCDADINLNSFPGAFSQIFTNFIMNSLLHGFKEIEIGSIYIDAYRDNQKLYIRYRDNGVGINKDNLDKIFEPFYTTMRGQGGSGLGMHLVFNLVTQKLGGKISVVSTLGEGVEFCVELDNAICIDHSQSA